MTTRDLFSAGVLMALVAQRSFPQTQVDLRTQAKSVDFSAATATRPLKTGTSLPGTCSTGEMFFKADAAAGQNLYGCASANTWVQQAGGSTVSGGGASSVSQLLDFQVARTASATLSVGANCSASAPCNARFGNTVYSITGGSTVTLTGGTGAAYIYITPAGVLTAGHNVALNCAGCVGQSGVTSFPPDSIPIASWVVTAGTWEPVGSDFRTLLSGKNVTAGTGLTSQENLGLTTIAIDQASIGLRISVPLSATSTCTQGSWAADFGFFYICAAQNSWRRTAVASW